MLQVWGRATMHTGCFVGGDEGTRSLLRLRRRWEDDIKMYFQEIVLMRGLG